MSFTTSQTLTITATAADANRVQAAADGLGYPSIEAMIIALVISHVSSWEQANNERTYVATYTPVNPT